MNTMPSSERRKPMLQLDLESVSAASNPFSHLTATRDSPNEINEMDSTLMAEQSIASTTTPSISALDLYEDVMPSHPTNLAVSGESRAKNIFVVKVCEQLHCSFYLLISFNRIQTSSSPASNARLTRLQKTQGIKHLLIHANPMFSLSAHSCTLSPPQLTLVLKPT
jgi:hypothetical protein